jgi:hypothetical protein
MMTRIVAYVIDELTASLATKIDWNAS